METPKPKAEGGDVKPPEQTPGEQKPGEQKPAEQTPGEQKPAEQKPSEQKPAEQTAATTAETEVQKAIRVERERVTALQKLDRPATHEIITKAIAEGKTVADISNDLFDALERAGVQTARRADASQLTIVPASDAGETASGNGFGKLIKEKAQARTKQMRPLAHSRN